jgi:glycine/D-amino acid oxidase-like deaminating enzyme
LAHEQSIGYDAQLLAPDQVAAVTPGVDPRAITRQGAIFNPGEGWVDLPSLIGVLLDEFATRGGEIIAQAGRASVEVRGGRVTGVSTTAGKRFEADAVLVAAGAAVPKIVEEVGYTIPDATPIALLVRSKPLKLALRAVLNTPRVAVRPTPDGAIVFDSAWSEEEVIRRADGTYEVKNSTIQQLMDEASAVLAGNPKMALGQSRCRRTGSPYLAPLTGSQGTMWPSPIAGQQWA